MELQEIIQHEINTTLSEKTWASIQAYMHSCMVSQFRKLELGGDDRGVHWNYFTESTLKRNRSKVPGRFIPYIDGVSKLMVNTGLMRQSLLSDMRVTGNSVELITPIAYAGEQNEMRPFNFISEAEAYEISNIVARMMDHEQ